MTAHVRVSRLSQTHAVVFVFLRLLVVVAVFGLSGWAPAAVGGIAGNFLGCNVVGCAAACDVSGCSGCPLDQDGRECPPGRPSCHCSPAGMGLPPLGELLFTTLNLDIEAAAVPYEAAVPRAPPVSDVYRPPRGVAMFS